MKTGTCFLLASLMLISLLLAADPAAALSDTKPHYATATNCTTHVATPTHYFQGPSFQFNLCRGKSQATLWRVQILNYMNQPITTCAPSPPRQLTAVTPTPITFTCTGLLLNVVTKAKVFWKVGTSAEMEHIETFKRTH
jgi:hypothetical protein